MRRLFLLPVVFWLTIFWAPKISEAIFVTIEGQDKFGGQSCGTNQICLPIAGTYGNFSIIDSGGLAQVIAIDGSTVDRVTLTNSLIRNNSNSPDTLDIQFSQNFGSSARATGSYPAAIAANGTFQGLFTGDSLLVAGFSFGELIKSPSTDEVRPSFVVTPTNSLTATFSRSMSDNTECGGLGQGSCSTGEQKVLVALTLRGGDSLRLPSSIDMRRSDHPIPEPSTLVLVGLGLTGLVIVKRRRSAARDRQ